MRAVLVVTTDKCYELQPGDWPYRETDALAGSDPYSSSKACMELVAAAFRDSFFSSGSSRVGIATARAGNVIGGGDWGQDRLLPDMIRSFAQKKTVTLRNPAAARPWQFVLEPLRGYLLLAERLYRDATGFSGAWNFGPAPADVRSVQWIAETLAHAWGADAAWEIQPGVLPQESQMIQLDCSKAAAKLSWQPVLDLAQALPMTVDWYRAFYSAQDMRATSLQQLAAYSARIPASPELLPEISPAR